MKPRFSSQAEIIALIDKYHSEIATIAQSIEAQNHLADCLRLTCEAHRISSIRDRADKMTSRIRWRQGRLLTLKGKLAEIQTPNLPNQDNPESSVAAS